MKSGGQLGLLEVLPSPRVGPEWKKVQMSETKIAKRPQMITEHLPQKSPDVQKDVFQGESGHHSMLGPRSPVPTHQGRVAGCQALGWGLPIQTC